MTKDHSGDLIDDGDKIINVSSSLSPSLQVPEESGSGQLHFSSFLALKGELNISQPRRHLQFRLWEISRKRQARKGRGKCKRKQKAYAQLHILDRFQISK